MNTLLSLLPPGALKALAGPVRWLFSAAAHTAADHLSPADLKRVAVASLSFLVVALSFAAQVNNGVAYVFALLAWACMSASHLAARFLEPPADMTKAVKK